MSVEAFILAGGGSTRFGSPKAFMMIDGRSVLEGIVDAVREAFPDANVRAVMANEAQFPPVLFSLPIVFDLYPGRGPLSGLYTALAYAQSDWVLALACDYSDLSAALLKRLSEMTADDVDAVVPVQSDGRLQPLCAFYRPTSCLPVVEEMVTPTRPAPPLRAIFEKVRTRKVGFHELSDLPGSERFFTNLNTPADLQNRGDRV